MQWFFNAFSVILVLLAIVVSVVALKLYLRRLEPGSKTLSFMLFSVAIWSVTAGLEIVSVSLQNKILLSKLGYIGVCSAPVFLFSFILEINNHEHWLTLRNRVAMWTIPIIMLLLTFTNEAHHLIWNSFTPVAGTNLIVYGHGGGFWILLSIGYLAIFSSAVIMFTSTMQLTQVYRRQSAILFIALIFPFIASAIYIFDLTSGLDPTPMGFAMTGLLLAWGVYQRSLFDLVPIARERVLEWMEDSLVILDSRDRILDLNRAAVVAFNLLVENRIASERNWIGASIELILDAWPELKHIYPTIAEGSYELSQDIGDTEVSFDLDVSYFTDRNPGRTLKLLVFHDVTRLKRVQKEALHSQEIASALLNAANILGSANRIERGLEEVLIHIHQIIQYDCGAFLLREDEQFRVASAYGFPEHIAPNLSTIEIDAPVEEFDVNSEMIIMERIKAITNCRGSGLLVTICFQERISGLLVLLRRSLPPFTEQDKIVSTSLAAQVSIALENSRMFEQLRQMALTDALTGLFNRRSFFNLAQNSFDHALRYNEPFALILFDLDHFKEVNDKFGHSAGDEVLLALSVLCRRMVRKIDIIGRYGGEEFIIALPNTNLHSACAIAERLRDAIATANITHHDHIITIKASFGVAIRIQDDSLDHVIERADQQLLRAKQMGRNRVIGAFDVDEREALA